jgi:hypothetical protein
MINEKISIQMRKYQDYAVGFVWEWYSQRMKAKMHLPVPIIPS